MRTLRWRPLAALFALAAAPWLPAQACSIVKLAELPVTMAGTRPLVPVKVNGTDALFLADSGAFYSFISEASAAQFGLRLHRPPPHLNVEGIGGHVDTMTARVDDFRLGDKRIDDFEFIVGGSEAGGRAAGLIGQNVLGIGDVEYDLANGAIRLFRPGEGCEDTLLAYWVKQQPYAALDLDWHDMRLKRTAGNAYVNGKRVHVVFDTGASTSVLALPAAARAGVTPDMPGAMPAGAIHGAGRDSVPTWIVPIASFKIGEEEIKNTHLRIGAIDLSDTDMLLGADFFLSHRVYVANSRDRVYFTYNGGPVFNLTLQSPPPAGNGTEAASGPAPGDAAAYARRGAAYAARHDFEHAIADLTRACELEPGNAHYLSERGRAHLAGGQPREASIDLDAAIAIDPGEVDALLARAALRAAARDASGALADLDAAQRIVPKGSNLRLGIAEHYERADRLDAAVAQFDLWIAAHEDDAMLPTALNGRCWARTLLGTELERALEDCDRAIDRGGRTAEALNSRAFVYLRLGRLDKAIADFDAALAIKADDAWSLYGRGLARLRKGLAAEGQTDIVAAIAAQPAIAAAAARHGLGPEKPAAP